MKKETTKNEVKKNEVKNVKKDETMKNEPIKLNEYIINIYSSEKNDENDTRIVNLNGTTCIHTLKNYESYLNDLKNLQNFDGLAFATKSYNPESITFFEQKQKTNNNINNNNARLDDAFHIVYEATAVKRSNSMYFLTYNNELIVEIYNDNLYPIAFYNRALMQISEKYAKSTKNCASHTETTKNVKIENCFNKEKLLKMQEDTKLEFAAKMERFDIQLQTIDNLEKERNQKIIDFAKLTGFSLEDAEIALKSAKKIK